jgi:predicted nucleic acid-binding protein
VRFWDASAIVPLCVREDRTEELGGLAKDDPGLAVWWVTPVEVASALARRVREGAIEGRAEDLALARLGALAEGWVVVSPSADVRRLALRLLRVHALRAADALQLAAALVWAEERPAGREFVVLDDRLHEAARREGFVLRPERA